MVSLSDIPVLGKAVDMISEAMVKAAYRGLRYMFCYKNLVNNFNSEFDKFKVEEGRVSRKVVEERDSGKILEDHVSKWQKEVEKIQLDSEEFRKRYENRASWKCIKCVPIPNPLSRFRLGREAEQMTKTVAELTQSGKELLATEIAHLPPSENLPKTDGEFQYFASRKDAYDKLWESLVTEGSPQIHGIYGMPGVGKTRIAEQIWEDAKTKGKFDKVTRAVVSSEKLDVIKLQNDLARHLNCKFESQDDIDSRASQLKQSIMNGGKVLIILDDVWREIHLDVIGIPFGHDDTTSSKGSCKILLTSRKKKVCLDNNCIDPVEITALTSAEAWDMFKESVGTGDIPDESLARKVCDKCAGLPLVIRAVGKALKTFKSCDMWNYALQQLQNCDIERVPGIDQQVYACLKLSFNMVVPDAKLCLLLCSLYPEDANISIDMLIELATGSQLVQGGPISVRAMVALLKSSSLVLESGYGGDYFKLHDIIRDVARSIAVNDHAFLFAKCDSRLPSINYGSTKLLCLEVEESDDWLNQDIQMAKNDIHTLWIASAGASYSRHEIQVREAASMFVNLRCLILRKLRWEPVLQLGELRTLVLERCDIRNTDFSFISEKLETLCIWDCDLPEPLNIINLKHLRKLQIRHSFAVVLVANTISSLSSCLEELHIPYGFKYHKAEEHNDDEVNYNNSISQQLAEFTNFRRLKSLNMSFREEEHNDDDISVQAPKVISNLSEFHISVGYPEPKKLLLESAWYPSLTRKSIHLCGKRFEGATFQSLIERAQVVILTSTNVDVSSAFNTNNTAAFADLKHLEIYGSAMKYLFCNSVAKCLMQLEELVVNNCPVMEAIVMNEGSSNSDGQEEEEEDMNIINFPKLKSLELSSMPKLKSFNIEKKKEEKKDIMQHTASTISLNDNSLFPQEIAFPALEELWLISLSISDIWGKLHFNDNASSFSKLKRLEVWGCTKLETVIPLAMLHKLQNLKYLEIKDCSSVIHEVGTCYDNNTAAVCPLVALTKMHLLKLPCLRNTWLNSIILDHSQAITNLYPNLKELEIQECNSLSNVFLTSSIARDLMMHLEELKVDDCEMMTEIIGAAAGEHKISTGGIVFPKLRTLRLLKLKILTSFRRNQSGEADNICKVVFPNLVECSIQFCHEEIKLEDIEFGRDGSTCCQLKSLEIRCHKEKQLPSTWQLQLDNLEYLTLDNCWWHEQHIVPCFTRLKQLEVIKSGRSTLFPFSFFSSLQQLERIKISNCALLEGIVEEDVRKRGNIEASSSTDKNKKKIMKLFKLEYVCLKDLPNLRSFMSGADYECHMPALREVEIDNCGFSTLFTFSVISSLQRLWSIKIRKCALLEGIVEEEDVRRRGNIEASSSRDKKKQIIEFIQLIRVTLNDLPNLRSFMSGADYECHMPALGQVDIDNCGFSTLFTCSTNLQKLWMLRVSNCRLLEYIVRDDDDDDDDISKTDDKIIITLSHPSFITLYNLPNLKSFKFLKFPCFSRLRQLQVTKSGRSTLFPFSVISSLQQLQVLEISDCALLEDIVTMGNAEASSMDNKKIIEFIQLETVVLKDLPKLRCFMYGADYECHMPALKEVKTDNCGFVTLFTFSVISSLQQLQRLEISDCALLEGIVEEEDVRKRGNIEASSSRDKKKKIITLFQLIRVTLRDLPNLRSFMYGADYECHMPALDYVDIDNCGFSTLFTCSTNLQQLCYLKVSNCRLLEYIVGDVRDDDDDDDDDDDISKTDDRIIITLSQLRNIKLENLPNLKSFGRTSSYDFDMPELSDFTLLQCPQVENFSSLKTSTGTSIRVKSDWDNYWVVVRDLDDYIKENRKRDYSNLISDEGAARETDDS